MYGGVRGAVAVIKPSPIHSIVLSLFENHLLVIVNLYFFNSSNNLLFTGIIISKFSIEFL